MQKAKTQEEQQKQQQQRLELHKQCSASFQSGHVLCCQGNEETMYSCFKGRATSKKAVQASNNLLLGTAVSSRSSMYKGSSFSQGSKAQQSSNKVKLRCQHYATQQTKQGCHSTIGVMLSIPNTPIQCLLTSAQLLAGFLKLLLLLANLLLQL